MDLLFNNAGLFIRIKAVLLCQRNQGKETINVWYISVPVFERINYRFKAVKLLVSSLETFSSTL